MKYNKNDLKGKRFGKLLVLRETDSRADGGSIVWQCKCDCGNIVEISSKRLVNGLAVSCGCFQKERQKYSMKKLHNRQFKENTNIDLIAKQKANVNSQSGFRGVHWCSSKNKWIASLSFQKEMHKKAFKNKEDAIKYRKELEDKYFKPILEKYNKADQENT